MNKYSEYSKKTATTSDLWCFPSLHNISDQLFLSQSRSSPALGSEGSRKDDKVLAHSELVDRFKVLIQKATDFLFMSGMGYTAFRELGSLNNVI